MTIRLPDPSARMTPAAKEAIIRAVRRGELARDAALATYGLSDEEFDGWERRFLEHGQGGLRATRIQDYRETRHD